MSESLFGIHGAALECSVERALRDRCGRIAALCFRERDGAASGGVCACVCMHERSCENQRRPPRELTRDCEYEGEPDVKTV